LGGDQDVEDFKVSPNSDFVVYKADEDILNRIELYRVNLANPGVSTKLSAPLTVDRDVRDFAISPDSSKVLYRADPGTLDAHELFLVNVAAPGTSQQVHPELTAGGEVSSAYRFSPDGTKVGYVADQEVDDQQELFVASVANPGVSTKLNGPMTTGGSVCRFEFSHDSTRVAYCGDQETDEVMELFMVSLATPGVSQKLNATLVSGGNVGSHYDFSSDDTFIVYEAEQDVVGRNELYRVDLAAPGVATKLNAPIVAGGGVWPGAFKLRPDGQHVDYYANQEIVQVWELYAVALANPGAATKLTPTMAGVGMYDFDYTKDGARVVYSAAQDTEFVDLYSVELSAPAVSTKLNGTLAAGGDVWDFTLIP
jgi:Tol biopolymer transport system component